MRLLKIDTVDSRLEVVKFVLIGEASPQESLPKVAVLESCSKENFHFYYFYQTNRKANDNDFMISLVLARKV